MNRHFSIITFILLFITNVCLLAQTPEDPNPENGEVASNWKGFKRLDFKFSERDARLIIPSTPLPNNPWIWRARFPDWHTEADSILISEGYHLAYINTDNKYGSPAAVKIWDSFYAFLTKEYELSKKVALIGVSRGGLFVYNWAKSNPDKVACIYAEAPVCDIKSWPWGFGKSEGSAEDWARLKKEYGFVNDNEARQYADNPLDNLEALAALKVPVMHMIGLQDKIVPPDENTFQLVKKYIDLGGIATVVPCTEGEQKLQGHHFPIETPRYVADFIKYNTDGDISLSSSDYHKIRSGLRNSQIRFEREKTGKVAFLGGSITYNPGWRDSVSNYLQGRFPETKFEFIEAGISSMGTTPAAFRLERDVLSAGRIDLLFEEAAVNDATNGRTSEEQKKAMEGIVRNLRKSNPAIDIVLMHFVDPDKIAQYNLNKTPAVIVNHNQVAEHYNIPTINLAKEVTDRINNGEFTWEDDFIDLHPSPFGQGVYANSINHFLDEAFSNLIGPAEQITAHDLPVIIDKNAYDNGFLLEITKAKLSKGWSVDTSWDPKDGTGTRPNFVNVPMLIGNKIGETLKLRFRGNAIGIAVASGKDAGSIEYRVDRHKWIKLNLFTKWSEQLHLPWYYTLATGLSQQEHLLEIRIAELKDERSTGNACRIRYFFINRN